MTRTRAPITALARQFARQHPDFAGVLAVVFERAWGARACHKRTDYVTGSRAARAYFYIAGGKAQKVADSRRPPADCVLDARTVDAHINWDDDLRPASGWISGCCSECGEASAVKRDTSMRLYVLCPTHGLRYAVAELLRKRGR